jgi:hypothetical protein
MKVCHSLFIVGVVPTLLNRSKDACTELLLDNSSRAKLTQKLKMLSFI